MRGSAATSISAKAIVIGGVVGVLVGFIAGCFDHRFLAHPVALLLHSFIWGAPTGAMAGAFAATLVRGPARRP
jgi:hypothetical protein